MKEAGNPPDIEVLVLARRRIIDFMPGVSSTFSRQETGLPQSVMQRLAEADAFDSLSLSRRASLWKAVRIAHRFHLANCTPPMIASRRCVCPRCR